MAGDTNGQVDIFVKDLLSGAVVRVNTAADGTEANGYSDTDYPPISADGRYVVFRSDASNLVLGDTNDAADLFVKDLLTGTIVRVNTTADGTQTDGLDGSFFPSVSADGRYVAFASYASNLVLEDTNETSDIFVKDIQTGAIARVNVAANGMEANAETDSYAISISTDGRYVVFSSYASNLVEGDTNDDYDVFIAPNQLYQSRQIVTDVNSAVVINDITVSDVDSTLLYIILSVGHGNLVLQNTSGLTFADADGSDGTLTFSGAISDLNAALAAGILYTPSIGFIGDDMLGLVIDDQFPGGGLTDSATLSIKVLPPPIILGTVDDDVLTGTNDDDTFNGGAGDDTLIGGDGNDIYVFNLGDGIDTIIDSTAGGAANIVSFGAGIDPNSISFGLGSLLVRYGDQGDAIHIENFDPNDAYNPLSVGEFSFVDGTVWSYDDLINRGFDLAGTDGDDVINGTNVTDRMTGGAGNDSLDAGAGDDTYFYNAGDGLDTLTDAEGTDTVSLGTGYAFDNTVIRTNGGVAHLRFLDADGTEGTEGIDITLNSDGTGPIEAFAFEDGTIHSLDDLLITSQTLYGTKNADTLIGDRSDDIIYAGKGGDAVYGRTGNDILYGEKGNDKLYGEGGNDALYGGKGKDILDGGAGDDLLEGGKGHDTLVGGKGNDTLILGGGENSIRFDLGDGWDTVQSTSKDAADNDIRFGAGITPDKLWFERVANDLRINVLGTNDGMTIEGWYANKHKPLEEIKTQSGYELEDKKIELLVQAMAAFNPTPGSDMTLPTEMPDSLQPVLAAAWETGH